MMDFHIEETIQTHKDTPSNFLEQYHKHGKAINMPKYDRWSNKKKGEKTTQDLMG